MFAVQSYYYGILTNIFSWWTSIHQLLEKWFPLQGERAHSLKLFCMYDKRFEISKPKYGEGNRTTDLNEQAGYKSEFAGTKITLVLR